MGSTRAGRHCETISSWILEIARANTSNDIAYERVDLRDWPLPMDDEPGIPALGTYDQPHTRAWSDKVGQADAFVLVSPQYNWGYPAPLKNALDHLYAEWRGKPVVIVTYGGHGGGKCADQLRQVADGLKLRPVPTMPRITLSDFMIRGGPIDPPVDFQACVQTIRQAFTELESAVST